MKRSHNYSSSESDLDDNVEVEKDSGDENGLVNLLLFLVCFVKSSSHVVRLTDCNLFFFFNSLLFYLSVNLIPTARCHPPPPPRFKPEKGAEG